MDRKKHGEPRLSLQALLVLQTFLDSAGAELSGAKIGTHTRIASGTLYPILLRLESAGWLLSRWEQIDPSKEGRPRRRLYRLTGAGQVAAQAALTSLGFKALPA